MEGILDWAVNGIPVGNGTSQRVNGKAKRLPRPSLLCSECSRLRESAEERAERSRIRDYAEHLKAGKLCSSSLTIEETMRELEERVMK